MRSIKVVTLFCSLFLIVYSVQPAEPFSSDSIMKYAKLTDDYIRLVKHPDYWNNTVVGGKSRPSNIWTRGVFYEGHMAYYQIHPDTALFNYAYNWGNLSIGWWLTARRPPPVQTTSVAVKRTWNCTNSSHLPTC